MTNAFPVLKWESTEEASFHCSLDNNPFFDCGEGRSGQWIGRNISDGPHSFKVRATDTAGNIATPKSWSWIVGTMQRNIILLLDVFILKYK